MTTPWFTDAEVDYMCEGLEQDAAKVRHLKRMGLRVDRKPNGKPLAWRPVADAGQAQNAPQQDGPTDVVQSLQAWAQRRKQRGQATQGR
jgi:hypothetical protein